MLKKIITFSILFSGCVLANAQSKSVLSNGFYLNLGLAFPTQSFTATEVKVTTLGASNTSPDATSNLNQSVGLVPNIEIGNQWYFWKNDQMGFGLRASWFQFGFSSYNLNNTSPTLSVTNVDLRFVKLAPQFTYAFTKELALDVSFEVAPTVNFGFASKNDLTYGAASIGFLFAPGVKVRYKIFAAGFDYGFGSLSSGQTFTNDNSVNSSTYLYTGKVSNSFPRVYLGFKF